MLNKLAKIIGALTASIPFVLGHEEDEIAHMTGMVAGETTKIFGLLNIVIIVLLIILIYVLIKKISKNKNVNKIKRRKNG